MKQHIDLLADILMIPWFKKEKAKTLQEAVVQLVGGMEKYLKFLKEQSVRTSDHHKSTEPVRSQADNIAIEQRQPATVVKPQYLSIDTELADCDDYVAVSLQDHEPSGKAERRKWIRDLQLSKPVSLFTYRHGNNVGNIHFVVF